MISTPYSLIALLGISLFSLNFFLLPNEIVYLYDSKRLFLCFLSACLCVHLIFSARLRKSLYFRFVQFGGLTRHLTLLFFVLAFISEVAGLFPVNGVTNFFYFVSLFALILVFAIEKPTAIHFKMLVFIGFLCFVSVFVGYTIATFFGEGPTIFHILSYVNPRFMNQVQVWLIVPTIYLTLLSRRKITYCFPVINFAALFALDARGLGLAVVGAIALWMILDAKHRWKILQVSFVSLFIGFALSFFLLTPFPSYLLHGELSRSLMDLRGSSSGRVDLWFYAIDTAKFMGLGSYSFPCISENFIRPHNSLLKVLLNWGVVPSLIYIFLCITLLYQVILEKNSRNRIIGISLLCGLAYSLVSSVLDSPLSLLLACLFTGWFCGRSRLSIHINSIGRYSQFFIALLASVAILSIGLRVAERVQNDFYLEHVEETMRPQFWLGNNCPERYPELQRAHLSN